MATAAGIPALIAPALEPEAVASALAASRVGTLFHPAGGPRVSSFKLWLKYAKPTRGRAHGGRGRRAGAARARHEPAAGGVVEVEGELRGRRRGGGARGRTAAPDRQGIVNYSAESCAQIKGMKSAAVRELLPARGGGGRAPRLLRARSSARGGPSVPSRHGRHRPHRSPTSAPRRRRARARSRALAGDRPRTPPSSAMARRARRARRRRSSRPTRATWRPAPRRACRSALMDRLRSTSSGSSGIAADVRDDRGAARSRSAR